MRCFRGNVAMFWMSVHDFNVGLLFVLRAGVVSFVVFQCYVVLVMSLVLCFFCVTFVLAVVSVLRLSWLCY